MNSEKLKRISMMALLLAFVSSTASSACTPVPQFMYIFFGPNLWGMMSLIGLPVVVIFKCFFFARSSGLPTKTSVSTMFAGNLYSTLPGIVGTLAMTSIGFPPIWIAIIILLYFPSKAIGKANKNIGTAAAFIALSAGLVFSIYLFFLSQSVIMDSTAGYWILKIGYSTLAVSIGLFVTTGFEYSAIISLAKKYSGNQNLFPVVLRSNLYAMLISVGIMAMVMLPERLSSPDFLVMLKAFLTSVS